jgi:flagellar basal-body rod protein FlgC
MSLIGLFQGINISASGLRAQRVRQNVIASNIANAETTRTAAGGPYKRQEVILTPDPVQQQFSQILGEKLIEGNTTNIRHMEIPRPGFPKTDEAVGNGVQIASIHEDETPPKMIYNPTHPDANAEGYVAMPNINMVQEMVDLISATRAYEANATALQATKSMIQKSLEI